MASKREDMNAALAGNSSTGANAQNSGAAKPFVHLHVHSAYSLLEGALQLSKIIDLTVADDQPALAITDRNNLFGALEYSEKASKAGLQPIIGCVLEVDLCVLDENKEDTNASVTSQDAMVAFPSLVFLASNEVGYGNLTKLVSLAYLDDNSSARPHVNGQQVREYNEGLIVLSGGPNGPLNRPLSNAQVNLAEQHLNFLKILHWRDLRH